MAVDPNLLDNIDQFVKDEGRIVNQHVQSWSISSLVVAILLYNK